MSIFFKRGYVLMESFTLIIYLMFFIYTNHQFFGTFGIFLGFCEKGSTCKFAHTKTRIRICQQYLLGRCLDPECLLSHESNDSNAPMCLYYLKGSCSNPECRFIHRRPEHYGDSDYEIWVCRRFAIGGYCDRGEMCPLMHIFECPDFQEDGKCPRGRSCTLSHTITQRTQELMATPSNKYVREDDDVYVEEDKKKIIISSYTIDPEILLTVVPRGKYDIYLDNGPKKKKQKKGKKQEKDNQYIITLSDSDSEYNSDDNDIKNNLDYIQV